MRSSMGDTGGLHEENMFICSSLLRFATFFVVGPSATAACSYLFTEVLVCISSGGNSEEGLFHSTA